MWTRVLVFKIIALKHFTIDIINYRKKLQRIEIIKSL